MPHHCLFADERNLELLEHIRGERPPPWRKLFIPLIVLFILQVTLPLIVPLWFFVPSENWFVPQNFWLRPPHYNRVRGAYFHRVKVSDVTKIVTSGIAGSQEITYAS